MAGIGGGGSTHDVFGWGCAARSWKPLPYFRPKYTLFHTLFQTWLSKCIPCFSPCNMLRFPIYGLYGDVPLNRVWLLPPSLEQGLQISTPIYGTGTGSGTGSTNQYSHIWYSHIWGGGGGYSHIWTIRGCASQQGMVVAPESGTGSTNQHFCLEQGILFAILTLEHGRGDYLLPDSRYKWTLSQFLLGSRFTFTRALFTIRRSTASHVWDRASIFKILSGTGKPNCASLVSGTGSGSQALSGTPPS